MGAAVMGGMLAVTVLGALLVPAFYGAVERVTGWRRPAANAPARRPDRPADSPARVVARARRLGRRAAAFRRRGMPLSRRAATRRDRPAGRWPWRRALAARVPPGAGAARPARRDRGPTSAGLAPRRRPAGSPPAWRSS